MKEEIITFNTAKLAENKNFNVDTVPLVYRREDGGYMHLTGGYDSGEDSKKYISAPTQSLLQKWLREEHNIDVMIVRSGAIQSIREGFIVNIYTINTTLFNWNLGGLHSTYEEALEKGLQEALKLI